MTTKFLVTVRFCVIVKFSVTNEMHLLEFGSEKFDQFLNLLGDKIRLKGWDKYRGGLDVKGKVINVIIYSATYLYKKKRASITNEMVLILIPVTYYL